jgi:hypothetical protein
MTVTAHPTVDQAAQQIQGTGVVVPRISGIMSEYVVHKIQVTEDPLNGDQTLALGYTDGIDEFFVLEAIGGSDPFAGLPMASSPDGNHTQVIASYSDPAMQVYVFHEGGITFQIVGRNSLARLREVARRICQQVVTGR